MSPSARQLRMRITIAISGALCLLLLAPAARADRRTLIRAYEYATQPKGNLEFELWNDIDAPATGFSDAAITHRLELEYGLTDHWDMALYHVFKSEPGEPFHFDSWRLETRYRFAEKGEWPVDVMLYLEAERPANFEEPWEIEEKLILEKSFGNFALVGNLVGEQTLFAGQGYEWEVDLGARYEVTPALRLGLEGWTIHETKGGETESQWFVGPAFSVASGKIWFQLGAGFGVGDDAATASVRSVLGFNL